MVAAFLDSERPTAPTRRRRRRLASSLALVAVALDHHRVRREHVQPHDPRHAGVAYYSYGGNGLYILNWKFVYSYAKTLEYQGTNDGMIGVSSAQWGTYLGTLDADHLDEVGQPPDATEFNHLAFYERIARFLYTNCF